MELNITLKWFLGIVGIIFLGALGSGLWSLVFNPLFKRFGKFFMSVSSLGLKSVQNQIYAEVAKGHRDRSVKILMRIVIGVVFILIMIPFVSELKSKLLDQELKEAVQIVKNNNPNAGNFEDMVNNELKKIREERHSKSRVKMSILCLVVLLILFFRHLRIILIESSISHFEQCTNVCLPYLTDDEHKKILSDFALIKNKDDYSAIMNKLKEVAERGNLILPTL